MVPVRHRQQPRPVYLRSLNIPYVCFNAATPAHSRHVGSMMTSSFSHTTTFSQSSSRPTMIVHTGLIPLTPCPAFHRRGQAAPTHPPSATAIACGDHEAHRHVDARPIGSGLLDRPATRRLTGILTWMFDASVWNYTAWPIILLQFR